MNTYTQYKCIGIHVGYTLQYVCVTSQNDAWFNHTNLIPLCTPAPLFCLPPTLVLSSERCTPVIIWASIKLHTAAVVCFRSPNLATLGCFYIFSPLREQILSDHGGILFICHFPHLWLLYGVVWVKQMSNITRMLVSPRQGISRIRRSYLSSSGRLSLLRSSTYVDKQTKQLNYKTTKPP